MTRVPDRIAEPWGARTPYAPGEAWPERVDGFLADGVDPEAVRWAARPRSCPQTATGSRSPRSTAGSSASAASRARARCRGRLGPKDLFGWQANNSRDRLKTPLVRRHGELAPATWDEAMGVIVDSTRRLLHGPGPSALGFYTTGQARSAPSTCKQTVDGRRNADRGDRRPCLAAL